MRPETVREVAVVASVPELTVRLQIVRTGRPLSVNVTVIVLLFTVWAAAALGDALDTVPSRPP